MTTTHTRLMILSRCRLTTVTTRYSPTGRRSASGHMQKAALVVLAGHEGERVSMGQLADLMGCSRPGVVLTMRALRDEGLVEAEGATAPYSWRIVWERLLDLVPEAMEAAA